MRFVSGLVALGLVLAASSPVAAQSPAIVQSVEQHRNDSGEIEKTDGRLVHRSSGFVYPAMLGDMPARKTITYGPGDASVDYSVRGGANGDAWITLFVYPVTADLATEELNAQNPLIERWSARPIAVPRGLPRPNLETKDGWYSGKFAGGEVTTGYRLVQRGSWYLKARFTVPVAAGQAGLDRTLAAISAVPWDWLAVKAPTKVAATP